MAHYVWTQKAVDDYAIRHPYQKLCNNPRKAGEIATYNGKPLLCGEVLKAYMARGLVEKEKVLRKKVVSAEAVPKKKIPPAPKFLAGDDAMPKKRDLVVWRELHELYTKGNNITETSMKYGMSIRDISLFIRRNRKKFEDDYGKIDFSRNVRKAG